LVLDAIDKEDKLVWFWDFGISWVWNMFWNYRFVNLFDFIWAFDSIVQIFICKLELLKLDILGCIENKTQLLMFWFYFIYIFKVTWNLISILWSSVHLLIVEANFLNFLDIFSSICLEIFNWSWCHGNGNFLCH
jgi:hypothetical protein